MRTLFILVLSAGIVATLEAIFFGVRFLMRQRSDQLQRRLEALAGGAPTTATLLRRGRLSDNPAVAAVLRGIPLALRSERLLEEAGAESTVAELWTYAAAAAGGALVVGMAVGGGPFMVAALVVLGGALPFGLQWLAAARRSHKLSEQLPEALDMMSRSLRAGHAISAAFQMVATEMPDPVNLEFGRAFEEQRLGLSLEQAIVHMTQRTPRNGDLKIFAVSAIIQKETGGNLAEIMGGIAETIRARYRFHGKVRALTAEGRASGILLSLLPPVFAGLMQVLNPGYLRPLFTEPMGQAMLAAAVAAWALGVLWMRRLTQVGL